MEPIKLSINKTRLLELNRDQFNQGKGQLNTADCISQLFCTSLIVCRPKISNHVGSPGARGTVQSL